MKTTRSATTGRFQVVKATKTSRSARTATVQRATSSVKTSATVGRSTKSSANGKTK